MPEDIKLPQDALNRIVTQADDALNRTRLTGTSRSVLVQAIAMALREARDFLIQQANQDAGDRLLTVQEIAALDQLAELRRAVNDLDGVKVSTNGWLDEVEAALLAGPGRRQWKLLRRAKAVPQ